MKIAHLANMYGPTSGGLRTTVDRLAGEYHSRGFEVLVITPSRSHEEVMIGDSKWAHIASPRLPLSGGYRIIINLPRVRRLLVDFQPEIMEISDRSTLLLLAPWARRRGIKVVLFAHERLDDVLESFLSWLPARRSIIRLWNNWVSTRVDHVVATTNFAALEFSDFREVEVVPLGVDHETFQSDIVEATCNVDIEESFLFACTRLSPEKDPFLLLDVARELKARGVDMPLLIAGDGPLKSKLEARAKREKLAISFLGFVSNKSDLARHMAEASIFLAPGPIETFGLAALESLSCGTPVICRSSGAISEVIDEHSGCALNGDASTWTDAIVDLLGSDLDVIAEKCRMRAMRFSWSATANSLTDLYLSNLTSSTHNRETARF